MNALFVNDVSVGVLKMGSEAILPPSSPFKAYGFGRGKYDAVIPYQTGQSISIRDAKNGEEDYIIHWHQIIEDDAEVLIADRPLIRDFSQNQMLLDMGVCGSLAQLVFGEDKPRKYILGSITNDMWRRFVINKNGKYAGLPVFGDAEYDDFWKFRGHYIMTSDRTAGGDAILRSLEDPDSIAIVDPRESKVSFALVPIMIRV